MRYGAMNFPVVPVLDEIDRVAGLGFDYLELAMDPPMAHFSVLLTHRLAITKSLQDAGLGLVCHLPTFVSAADLTESIRRASQREMLLSLDLAAELGAEKVVLHPPMASGMGLFVVPTVKELAFEFFEKMVEAAAERDMPLCLENMMPRNILAVEPEDFFAIFERFPNVLLTLDSGHAHIDDRSGSRLRGFVDRFADKIGHLHLSDNRGGGDEHLAVGQGTIDFASLVSNLRQRGYDDTLTLEIFSEERHELLDSRRSVESLFARER